MEERPGVNGSSLHRGAACQPGPASRYMPAFAPHPSREPDEDRPLRVTVNIPGARVRTNTGDYAEP